jgi:hypothetical protein
MKSQGVSALATALNEQTSPESRRERLARERQALEPTILALQHGHAHPMYTARLRKALELLRDNPVTAFVEGNAEAAPEYAELVTKAIEKLEELRDLQLAEPAIAAQTVARQPQGRRPRAQ